MSPAQAQSAHTPNTTTVDAEDVAKFSRIAEEWWDANGKFKPLHRLNPVRLEYLRTQILAHTGRADGGMRPLSGLRLLDIGCGGGLISEPMARLGAEVTGIDASEKNVAVAKLHAENSGLRIDYRASAPEALATSAAPFDVVLALEIIEHVADTGAFYDTLRQLVKPGGLLIMSTINRTPQSYVKAIIGAEYVLRWLPRGTHQWSKFLRPSEMRHDLEARGFAVGDVCGVGFHPLKNKFFLDNKDLNVNFMLTASRP
jgi:2-polyprenyl-6-hydroxyphenyl methylase/3-demethylubiquinone-9 3-methyltransferase